MYFVKTPGMFRHFFSKMLWRVPADEKVLFLTFDDGPVPEVTPWVLQQLEAYEARATFFCVGDNVRKHADLYQMVCAQGHTVGNHTFHHLNGWETEADVYLENAEQCRSLVDSPFFRPPYGRLTPSQSQSLVRAGYELVMWDVLSADFDRKLTGQQVFDNVRRHAMKGSVVVFHDSIKAWDRLEYALPATLAYFASQGYRFGGLDEVSSPAWKATEAGCV